MFDFLYKLYKKYFYTNESEDSKFYYLSLIKESDDKISIHGLWPQYSKNSYPSYCKDVTFDISKLKSILPELNEYWYSGKETNNEFWEHEYIKHGSCMFNKGNELDYFLHTLNLYKIVVNTKIYKKYMTENSNKILIPLNLNLEFI